MHDIVGRTFAFSSVFLDMPVVLRYVMILVSLSILLACSSEAPPVGAIYQISLVSLGVDNNGQC